MELAGRAKVHAALGDVGRLHLVDMLARSDLSVQELAESLRMPGNLLAHHLRVLEKAGVIERRVSEGDHRRRYVTLRRDTLQGLSLPHVRPLGSVLFVCSHNSARSQYAAARWRARTGNDASSAGSQPAARVNGTAVRVAAETGIDLSGAVPQGYESIDSTPDLVISVCDRAREAHPPSAPVTIHWSIPDPVAVGTIAAFRLAFAELDRRIEEMIG